MFLSIAAIENNEVLLASDIVGDKISTCVDDQAEGWLWITDSNSRHKQGLSVLT